MKTQCVSITTLYYMMLFVEIIDLYPENHMKLIRCAKFVVIKVIN